MAKSNLTEKHERVLQKFIKKHKENPNVVGILLAGSFIHSIPDENSDLDVIILLDKSKTRTRGNTWIEGVEVEYFINPVKKIRHEFETEQFSTIHMFANNRVLYKKGNQVDTLIREAKKILKKPRKKMPNTDKEIAKYFLDDMEKDLIDTYLKKDKFAFYQISAAILDKSIIVFNQVYRLRREKAKRLFHHLKNKDKKFAELYKKALFENNMDKKFKHIRKLIHYLEDKLDGKRTKEWEISSPCTYD